MTNAFPGRPALPTQTVPCESSVLLGAWVGVHRASLTLKSEALGTRRGADANTRASRDLCLLCLNPRLFDFGSHFPSLLSPWSEKRYPMKGRSTSGRRSASVRWEQMQSWPESGPRTSLPRGWDWKGHEQGEAKATNHFSEKLEAPAAVQRMHTWGRPRSVLLPRIKTSQSRDTSTGETRASTDLGKNCVSSGLKLQAHGTCRPLRWQGPCTLPQQTLGDAPHTATHLMKQCWG